MCFFFHYILQADKILLQYRLKVSLKLMKKTTSHLCTCQQLTFKIEKPFEKVALALQMVLAQLKNVCIVA